MWNAHAHILTTEMWNAYAHIFTTVIWNAHAFFTTVMWNDYAHIFTAQVLLDYIRLYLLIGLGTRNIVGLFVCFVFFFLVLWIEVSRVFAMV